jgi:hypothetical protein
VPNGLLDQHLCLLARPFCPEQADERLLSLRLVLPKPLTRRLFVSAAIKQVVGDLKG